MPSGATIYEAVGVRGNIGAGKVPDIGSNPIRRHLISKDAEVQGKWKRRAYIPHESRRCNAAGFKSLNPSDTLCWSGDGNV